MKVLIPSPLVSYTRKKEVEAEGDTIAELLSSIDRQYPGIRFRIIDEQGRIRRHMRIFVNAHMVDDLSHAVRPTDVVQLVQALSGG